MKAKQLFLTALALGAAGSLSAQDFDIQFGSKALSLRKPVVEVSILGDPVSGFQPWSDFRDNLGNWLLTSVTLSDDLGTVLPVALSEFADDANRDKFPDMTFVFDISDLLADETRRTEQTFTLAVETVFGDVFTGTTTIKIR